MPHRGRLNVLACVLSKPLRQIISEISDVGDGPKFKDMSWGSSGDVKYHLGATNIKKYDNKKVQLSILPNPSHLETVNPVLYGVTRSYQDYLNDKDGEKCFSILLHGDSSLYGQGVVYENLQMQDLVGYSNRGTIHVVCNNQIGFTTDDKILKQAPGYVTNVAKTVNAPIIHINAEEPEIVDYFMEMAVDYRFRFKKDIFLDIIGYRKFGHNELDQPTFTQPIMYDQIKNKKSIYQLYRQKILEENKMSQQDIENIEKTYNDMIQTEVEEFEKQNVDFIQWKVPMWQEMIQVANENTNINQEILTNTAHKLWQTPPENFTMHPLLKKIIQKRVESINQKKGIDMPTAEQLAFGTLMQEGYSIRLSGQDVERGTFSHRHAVYVDQKSDTDQKHTPLNAYENEVSKVNFVNSHLSEYGVLGFDYGYSITNPNCLVLWEAQFGDFANGAQIVIDNYIASAQDKWDAESGLVMLLPHGMDGQGPEHSSARIERFLQACNEDYDEVRKLGVDNVSTQRLISHANWQVVTCSTSANYFHALRRQLRRNYRKPLIAMTSKKLLRYPKASSDLDEFSDVQQFQVVIDDNINQDPSTINRVILLNGQIYYDLKEHLQTNNIKGISIIRIEQLAPFPYQEVKAALKQYKNAKQLVWCQEEHRNQGAYYHIIPRVGVILEELEKENFLNINEDDIIYAGRRPSSSPATGSGTIHKLQLEKFIKDAIEKMEN